MNARDLAWYETTIHAAFGAVREAQPNALALLLEDGREFTYEAFGRAADHVAERLLTVLQGPGHVALFADHGAHQALGLLAVAKAGAVRVPINPADPTDRHRTVLDGAEACVVVTSPRCLAVAEAAAAGRPVIVLDLEASSDRVVSVPRSPMDPSAIVFTSGSTGEPKGLVRPHRGEVFGFSYCAGPEPHGPGDRIGFAFAGANTGAMGSPIRALATGATLVPYDLRQRGLGDLAPWLTEQQVTFFQLPATVLRAWLDATAAQVHPDLRLFYIGGEAVHADDVRGVRRRLPPMAVIANRYAASEAGMVAHNLIGEDDPVADGAVPLGEPLPGVEVRILDDDGEAVPDGTPGQMVVRSPYAALGYWRRPDLDAATFAVHDDGTRTVRLADRVVRRGGSLIHLGRTDDTVKVAGNRVSIGEVEGRLRSMPEVHDVAVVVHGEGDGGAGEPRLVAHVVPAVSPAPAPGALRELAAQVLPGFMLPRAFVLHDELPRLTAGKVDRRALPAPPASSGDDQRYVAPRNDLERTIVRIWERVLDLDRVGVRDGFFGSGGDSLRAAHVVALIEEELGVDLPLAALAVASTVEEIAAVVERGGADEAWRQLVTVQPGGQRPPIFVLHGKGGNVVSAFHLAEHLGDDQPVYAIQSAGLSGRPIGSRSIEEMAEEYLGHIRRARPVGPIVLLGQSFGGLIAYEIARRAEERGEEVPLVVLGDTHLPALVGRQRVKLETVTRLELHRDNLRDRSLRRKVGYVRGRARARLRFALFPLTERIAERRGGRLPLALRSVYVERKNLEAAWAYRPAPYAGRVTLLRAAGGERTERDLGWSTLIADLEVVALAAEHEEMMREPFVHETARVVRQEIDRALGVSVRE